LMEKSLVYREEEPAGWTRFRMLETIREFALERLIAHGEEAPLRERHARYYQALVEANGALLFASARQRMLLAAEQENIQAALRWLVQHG
jgi:predicted ATPase